VTTKNKTLTIIDCNIGQANSTTLPIKTHYIQSTISIKSAPNSGK